MRITTKNAMIAGGFAIVAAGIIATAMLMSDDEQSPENTVAPQGRTTVTHSQITGDNGAAVAIGENARAIQDNRTYVDGDMFVKTDDRPRAESILAHAASTELERLRSVRSEIRAYGNNADIDYSVVIRVAQTEIAAILDSIWVLEPPAVREDLARTAEEASDTISNIEHLLANGISTTDQSVTWYLDQLDELRIKLASGLQVNTDDSPSFATQETKESKTKDLEERARAHFETGHKMLQMTKWQISVTETTRAIEILKQLPVESRKDLRVLMAQSLVNRGTAYIEVKNYSKGRRDLDQGIMMLDEFEIKPNHLLGVALITRGRAWMLTESLDPAELDLNGGIEILEAYVKQNKDDRMMSNYLINGKELRKLLKQLRKP